MHIEKDDGSTANKIVFYNYVPDNYTGMDKLFFSAAKDSVIKELEGVSRSFQVWSSIIIIYRLMTKMTLMRKNASLPSCKSIRPNSEKRGFSILKSGD